MGNTISLHCAANGLGSLVFTWERRQPDQSWVVTSSDSLTTYNTTTDGFYRCRVENEAGTVVSNETRVHVYGNIILQGGVINLQTEWLYVGPPIIVVQPVGGDTAMGHHATLTCLANGKGILVYSWEMMESDGDWTILDSSNATTYVTSVGGVYRCVVSNEAGLVQSNSATVNIYGEYCNIV